MENIILSLLLIKSMTIYEIKVFIQKNLSAICSDSLGSIQSAIKKLIGKDCIIVIEHYDNGVLKKEYQIAEKGLMQFHKWIEVPMNLQKEKNMEGGKFFFLGIASKEVRIESVKGYIKSLNAELEKLLQIQAYIEKVKNDVVQINVERIEKDDKLKANLLEVSKEKELETVIQNIYNYQMYSLEHGLKQLRDDIIFYDEIIEREMNS